MNDQSRPRNFDDQSTYSRRRFLGEAAATAAAAPLLAASAGMAAEQPSAASKPVEPKRKIKLGLVGCGGRGLWIGKLFQEHGGYDVHAVADYFQDVADRGGDALGVDKARRFSGLSGYKKVVESGAEAVALIVPPCFLPEHSSAAAEAGLHVYMAKPVAVDVPGCLRVEAAGKLATRNRHAFFVDYQMPTDPVNIQVAERVRRGDFGKPVKVISAAISGGHADPPKTANIESRLQNLVWDNDIAIGGGFILSFDIHSIDAALWVLEKRPIAAMGVSGIYRPDPHGDSHDSTSVVYEYADGPVYEHSGVSMPTGFNPAAMGGSLHCRIFGQKGHALLSYFADARFQVRGQPAFSGKVANLYPAGARRNIAAFHQDITAARFENPTVRRAVDGCLTCILGREAAARHRRLTMDELLKENKRIEADLSGLKA